MLSFYFTKENGCVRNGTGEQYAKSSSKTSFLINEIQPGLINVRVKKKIIIEA
jgi:hypothetical protein